MNYCKFYETPEQGLRENSCISECQGHQQVIHMVTNHWSPLCTLYLLISQSPGLAGSIVGHELRGLSSEYWGIDPAWQRWSHPQNEGESTTPVPSFLGGCHVQIPSNGLCETVNSTAQIQVRAHQNWGTLNQVS